MSEHMSETWEVFQSATNDFGIITMRDGKPVFVVDPGNIRLDDAERSVRACNNIELLEKNHEALVEALTELQEATVYMSRPDVSLDYSYSRMGAACGLAVNALTLAKGGAA